jgi:hypothetical protein
MCQRAISFFMRQLSLHVVERRRISRIIILFLVVIILLFISTTVLVPAKVDSRWAFNVHPTTYCIDCHTKKIPSEV